MARTRRQAENVADQSGTHADTAAIPRVAQALRLRRLGYTYAAIAQRCGYGNESGARKAIKTANARIIRDDARALVAWQLDQIDMALVTVLTRVEKGDLWAVDRLVPLLKRQAELMGLDAARDTAALAQPYEKRVLLMEPAEAAPSVAAGDESEASA